MKIIRYRSAMDMDIEFQDEFHYVKTTTYSNFTRGMVANPYDRTLYGVGYVGVGDYKTKVDGRMTEAYRKWACMFQRCYIDYDIFPAYCGKTIVSDEWHSYQNFAKWIEENTYKVNERLHIDKDILFPNCNIYSPKTCLLTPQRINMLFMNKPNNRGLPNGIHMNSRGRYSAKYNQKNLGTFDTVEEAYNAYAEEKEKVIKEVADEYKSVIPKKLYEALYSYKVDIRNDKNYVTS